MEVIFCFAASVHSVLFYITSISPSAQFSTFQSSGIANRIQVSVATANLLSGAGKEHWVTRREDMVIAKGKGAMIGYWLVPKPKKGTSVSSCTTDEGPLEKALPEAASLMKHDRLINWMTDLLLGYVRTIAATNEAMAVNRDRPDMLVYSPTRRKDLFG
jgi:hypothetical protein